MPVDFTSTDMKYHCKTAVFEFFGKKIINFGDGSEAKELFHLYIGALMSFFNNDRIIGDHTKRHHTI